MRTLYRIAGGIVFLALVASLSRVSASQGGDAVALTVRLVDGSQLAGTAIVTKLHFKTLYAMFDLELEMLEQIEMDTAGKFARVRLTNGDVLQGEFTARSLDIETILGKLTIRFEHIASIVVSPANIHQGLVAHYSFEGVSGDRVPDKSSSGHDAFMRGSGITRADLPGFFEFSGTDGYIESPDSPGLNMPAGMSILFWMSPASWGTGKSNGIVSKKQSDRTPGYVVYNDGYLPRKLNLRIEGDAGSATMLHSHADVDAGRMQHWAVTYDAEKRMVRWYKNGNPDTLYASVSVGDMTNAVQLHVGHAQTWGGCFHGSLGNVMIFNKALSAAEVKMICDVQRPVK
ncbi:MAG: LamG domain-containing protein [Bacteroidetes bacterium]|nr:LamG domain-containing protein [Bacteroidota bacterium]MCW5895858.1 LamG domain-containing protein [Bacteroidota bacterium]